MTRGRRAVLIAVAIALGAVACAPRRPTHTAVRDCVGDAEARRRACLQDCEGEFEDVFVGCYGAPSPCTARCQQQQMGCQAEPLGALRACTEGDPESCDGRLRSERAACATAPDRARCEADARRRASACWAACRRTSGPALRHCGETFTACLDGCVAR
jgi:hypothetical protein